MPIQYAETAKVTPWCNQRMKFVVVLVKDGIPLAGHQQCFFTVAEAYEYMDSHAYYDFELYQRHVQPFKRLAGANPSYPEPPGECCEQGLTLMCMDDPRAVLHAYTAANAHAIYNRNIPGPQYKLLRMARWKLYRISLEDREMQ